MTNEEKERMRELMLGYEDLDPEMRREVDDYLAQDADARLYLEKLQELEARAKEPIPMIELDVAMPAMSVEDETAERRSRNDLRTRLGLSETAEKPRAHRRAPAGARRVRMLIPAIAALFVLFMFKPWDRGPNLMLTDLEVVKVTNGSVTRSADTGSGLRTGDVFALSFVLELPASVVVYHIDPVGEVSLVVPASPDLPIPSFEPGIQQIPSESDAEEWALGDTSGLETFLVAIQFTGSSDLEQLEMALDGSLAPGAGRAQTVEGTRTFLSQRFDEVHPIEIEHRQ